MLKGDRMLVELLPTVTSTHSTPAPFLHPVSALFRTSSVPMFQHWDIFVGCCKEGCMVATIHLIISSCRRQHFTVYYPAHQEAPRRTKLFPRTPKVPRFQSCRFCRDDRHAEFLTSDQHKVEPDSVFPTYIIIASQWRPRGLCSALQLAVLIALLHQSHHSVSPPCCFCPLEWFQEQGEEAAYTAQHRMC